MQVKYFSTKTVDKCVNKLFKTFPESRDSVGFYKMIKKQPQNNKIK